jgi:hypothetical protein
MISSIVENKTRIFNELIWIAVGSISVVLIPTISHLISLPLYKANPMHWIIYLFCLSNTRKISSITILAITLPMFSLLTTGHPALPKAGLIGMELCIYGSIFNLLYHNRYLGLFGAYIFSKTIGIVIYYATKLIFLRSGVLTGSLISEPIYAQLIVAIGIIAVLYMITRSKHY